MAEPFLRLKLKSNNFQFFWLRYVAGFDQRHHCARCLLGKWSRLIRWNYPGFHGHVAGFETMGRLDEFQNIPLVYLCGVSRLGYVDNLHVPMILDEQAEPFVVENRNIWLLVSGMRRLEITEVPGSELVPKAWRTCRNWQFGWWQFPHARKDLRVIPGPQPDGRPRGRPGKGGYKGAEPHPELPGLGVDGDFLF